MASEGGRASADELRDLLRAATMGSRTAQRTENSTQKAASAAAPLPDTGAALRDSLLSSLRSSQPAPAVPGDSAVRIPSPPTDSAGFASLLLGTSHAPLAIDLHRSAPGTRVGPADGSPPVSRAISPPQKAFALNSDAAALKALFSSSSQLSPDMATQALLDSMLRASIGSIEPVAQMAASSVPLPISPQPSEPASRNGPTKAAVHYGVPSHAPVSLDDGADENIVADDAIDTESMAIAQVRQRAAPCAEGTFGRLVAATRHGIAYVLANGRIRVIAQITGSCGLAEPHGNEALPIVDICWRMHDEDIESAGVPAGTLMTPGTPAGLLATLAVGGDLCIGSVYAESNATLAYDLLSRHALPQVAPARGLSWSAADATGRPAMLAVFGATPEVVLLAAASATGTPGGPLSVGPLVRAASFDTGISGGVEAALFVGNALVLLAGAGQVAIVSVAQAAHLGRMGAASGAAVTGASVPGTRLVTVAKDARRTWLFRYGPRAVGLGQEIVLAVSLTASADLVIRPLVFERSPALGPGADDARFVPDSPDVPAEIVPCFADEAWIADMCADTHNSDDVCVVDTASAFAAYDRVTATLVFGSLRSAALSCVRLTSFDAPQLAAGVWPNAQGAVSVCSGYQMHSAPGDCDAVLYAYHTDSVVMHRLSIAWEVGEESDGEMMAAVPTIPAAGITATPAFAAEGMYAAAKASEMAANGVRSVAKTTVSANQMEPAKHTLSASKAPGTQQGKTAKRTAAQPQSTNAAAAKTFDTSAIEARIDAMAPEIARRVAAEVRAEAVVAAAVRDQVLPGLRAVIGDALGQQLAPPVVQAVTSSAAEGYALLSAELAALRSSLADVSALRKSVAEMSARMDNMQRAHDAQLTAIRDVVRAGVEAGIAAAMEPIMRSMPSANDIVAAVSHETSRIVPMIAETVRRESLARSAAASASPVHEPHAVPADPLSIVRMLIQRGDRVNALLRVLETADSKIFNLVLPHLGPAADVLDEATAADAFALPVAVALIQQLSFDLDTHTALRISWLSEIFTVFDAIVAAAEIDPACSAMLPTLAEVLDNVFANLRVLFTKVPASSPLYAPLKTLMRIVRTAMGSV